MEKLTFSVADYQAPLDLILHLLSKHKLNILDIDISALLTQYLAAMEEAKEQNLEVASEFLEMASRLVYIKTVSLLPKHAEEGDKLRAELTGQLIDYSICKAAAKALGEHYRGQDIFTRPAVELEEDMTYDLVHPAHVLYYALGDAMGKGARRLPPPREAFEPLVGVPVVSVTTKIFTIFRLLRGGGGVKLDALYQKSPERSGKIATFLALLELIKSKKIYMTGEEVRLSGK
ncbi:MAG: segregation/condensation protein A [Oscillospiraceae bacterium]|nr:segregation/condensation protein A [Oscillospiraceae bacterium]